MTFLEFQVAAARTHDAPFPERERLPVMALGLCGEAGEVADLIKKHMWHGQEHQTVDRLRDELGDLLWYMADIATSVGLTLDEIAAANVEKILRRYPQGFTPDGGIR